MRAGVRLDPKWDKLVTVDSYPFGPVRAVILAISEDRRERAVLDAVPKAFPYDLRTAVELLEQFPYTSIARYVLANLDRSNKPKDVIKALEQIPALADVVAAHKGKQKPAPKLSLIERCKPTLKELDANGKKQAEQSAKRFDGRKQTAADLLVGKGDEPLAPFYRLQIADAKGKHAYDAWLHMIDSGSIYKRAPRSSSHRSSKTASNATTRACAKRFPM